MKTLIIINGVTGAIGGACLARFSREHGVTIIGFSRQAQSCEAFIEDKYLPDNTLICSIGSITNKTDCESFIASIDLSLYEKIIYVHAVGVYPFELDAKGHIAVSHDNDGDGIDDRVVELSYNAFFTMTDALRKTRKPIHALIFGGIADKYHPAVHKSWWTVMDRIKENMQAIAAKDEKTSFFILNISSVICPHELLTRPFVFQKTNADPRYWLMPHEVAEQVAMLTLSNTTKHFIEEDLFHNADYYDKDYFIDQKFTARKKAELGIKNGK